MSERKRRLGLRVGLLALVAVLAVVAAGCGGDDESGASTEIEGLGSTLDEIKENARAEGEVNIVQWPQYATLVDEFTAATGCTVNTKDAGTRRRHDLADPVRRVRRRLRVGPHERAADGGRRRRTRQHGAAAELRGHRGGHQAQVVQLEGRGAVRGAARPRPEPARVPDGRRHAGAGQLVGGVGLQTRRTRARSRSTTTRSSSRTPPST